MIPLPEDDNESSSDVLSMCQDPLEIAIVEDAIHQVTARHLTIQLSSVGLIPRIRPHTCPCYPPAHKITLKSTLYTFKLPDSHQIPWLREFFVSRAIFAAGN